MEVIIHLLLLPARVDASIDLSHVHTCTCRTCLKSIKDMFILVHVDLHVYMVHTERTSNVFKACLHWFMQVDLRRVHTGKRR